MDGSWEISRELDDARPVVLRVSEEEARESGLAQHANTKSPVKPTVSESNHAFRSETA